MSNQRPSSTLRDIVAPSPQHELFPTEKLSRLRVTLEDLRQTNEFTTGAVTHNLERAREVVLAAAAIDKPKAQTLVEEGIGEILRRLPWPDSEQPRASRATELATAQIAIAHAAPGGLKHRRAADTLLTILGQPQDGQKVEPIEYAEAARALLIYAPPDWSQMEEAFSTAIPLIGNPAVPPVVRADGLADVLLNVSSLTKEKHKETCKEIGKQFSEAVRDIFYASRNEAADSYLDRKRDAFEQADRWDLIAGFIDPAQKAVDENRKTIEFRENYPLRIKVERRFAFYNSSLNGGISPV